MKKIFIPLALIGVLLVGSCGADYLNTAPTSATSGGTIFETTENARLAINGLSKIMTRQYLSSQGFNGEGTIKLYYGEYPGQNFTVNLPGWAGVIGQNYHTANNSTYTNYPWYYYYMIIGNANSIIEYIDDAVGPDNEKEYIKAQALTYRAYCYLMLMQLYSYRWTDTNNGETSGVVLRLEPTDEDLPLASAKTVYNQIYKDLDDAISLYTSSKMDRPAGQNFEVNIDVAHAVYARTAITISDYSKALEMAGKARAKYPMMTNAEYTSGFSLPNQEWIWSIYGASDETLYFYHYLAYIGYNSNASAVRTYPKRIAKSLYDKIPDTDIRKGMFLDPKNMGWNKNTGLGQADLKSYAFSKFPDLYSTATVHAYMNFKFKCQDQPGVGHINNFRSAEMLLIEAEANYFLNNTSAAQQNLEALILTSGRDPNYICTKTGAALLEEIKTYRGIELWGEGFDWFDKKRWGDTLVKRNWDNGDTFHNDLTGVITPEDKNKWTWVVPRLESDYNTEIPF